MVIQRPQVINGKPAFTQNDIPAFCPEFVPCVSCEHGEYPESPGTILVDMLGYTMSTPTPERGVPTSGVLPSGTYALDRWDYPGLNSAPNGPYDHDANGIIGAAGEHLCYYWGPVVTTGCSANPSYNPVMYWRPFAYLMHSRTYYQCYWMQATKINANVWQWQKDYGSGETYPDGTPVEIPGCEPATFQNTSDVEPPENFNFGSYRECDYSIKTGVFNADFPGGTWRIYLP